ncbi:hypothetical protein BH09BAC6_BH09BAC6_25900 [soil metagenome]|jgi:hypothetical protein
MEISIFTAMAIRLFKNLILTFICSSALVVSAIWGTYYIFDNYGVYFDTSLNGLIEWVFISNVLLILLSMPVFFLAKASLWNRPSLRLLFYYGLPAVALIITLKGALQVDNPMLDMEVWINPIIVVVFIVIHTICYVKLVKKGFITS